MNAEDEDVLLRSAALQTADSIRLARQQADSELIAAKEALGESNLRLQLSLAAAERGVNTLTQEIAARRLVEAQLIEARTQADQANRAKSQFLTRMGHELRTPLTAILGFAQLIGIGTPPPSVSQKRSADQIIKAGWYLLDVVNEILDLATIESGKLALVMGPVPLANTMLDCEAMIEPLARERGIRVSFPVFDDACQVNADRTRLKQVLVNLLSNALKYNSAKGTVLVACATSAPGRIRISVQDSGPGLAPDKIEQLFQPFNRLGQESNGGQGTGIGLVIAKRLVEMMGGDIGVRSTLGEGSVFWFDLAVCR